MVTDGLALAVARAQLGAVIVQCVTLEIAAGHGGSVLTLEGLGIVERVPVVASLERCAEVVARNFMRRVTAGTGWALVD